MKSLGVFLDAQLEPVSVEELEEVDNMRSLSARPEPTIMEIIITNL